jgi:DNA primase
MEIEKIDFREAVGILAKEAWIEMKIDFLKERQEKWEDIYALYRDTAIWYHEALFLKENEKYLQYLLDRAISLDTIKKFQLWCSAQPRDLFFYLKEKGYPPNFIIDSGIFVSESRDKFFGRITFPIANSMGHVVAFTGRVLDTALPKYLNSPASKIFDKSAILYSMHLAKQSIAKSWEVFIVEWQMDTITLHQAWVDNAVGISGTALTKDHIRWLKRFAKIIYLSLDADDPGVKATFASIDNLMNEDIEIRVIRIPNGKDPDEYIKSGQNYVDLKSAALSPIAFYMIEGKRQFDITTTIGKKKLIEKCLEFLVPIKSQIEIDMHMQEMSEILKVSKEAIFAEYRKALQSSRLKKISPENEYLKDQEIAEKGEPFTSIEILAGYIFHYWLFDLFFREFRYTVADLSWERDFSLLFDVVSQNQLDIDAHERIKIITLSIEETHPDDDRAFVEKACIDLIKQLHIALLIRERNRVLENLTPADEQYRRKNLDFILKARTLGLSQSIFQ